MIFKNKLPLILFFIIGACFLFLASCDEKDDYNYDGIEPLIKEIVGPGSTAAHGLTDFPATYSVPHRGGSTFQWSVTTLLGGGATIVKDEDFESIAYITFDESSVADVATITVVETTLGGKVSPAKTKEVTLSPFCQFNVDNFIGAYNCLEPGYGTYGVNFTKVDDNTIQADNFWDYGYTVRYKFDGTPMQKVEVVRWVHPGNPDLIVTGDGTPGIYNGCTATFQVGFIVWLDGAVYDQNVHTFTPAGKKSDSVIDQEHKKFRID